MAKKKAAKKATRPAAKKKAVKKPAKKADARPAAADLIAARIRELGDWRGETLAHVRALIREADPNIVEEWKWDIPVWSRDGIVCTGETYKEHVKLTFAKGAFLADPDRVFNAGFAGNVRRAIDLRAQDKLDGAAFRALIQEAVAFNQGHSSKRRR